MQKFQLTAYIHKIFSMGSKNEIVVPHHHTAELLNENCIFNVIPKKKI